MIRPFRGVHPQIHETAFIADSAQIIAVSPAHTPAVSPANAASEAAAEVSHHKEIKSPMVGTFYAASSPEAAPYVTVGQEITPDTVVCIIEAMKVMNPIPAVGEHTDAILRELGIDDETIAAWRHSGMI